MNKPANFTITLDQDAYTTFKDASEIVSKAGIRVPTSSQLIQTMVNAEMTRLNSRKIAQRFFKSVMQQIRGLAGSALDDEDDDHISDLPFTTAKI